MKFVAMSQELNEQRVHSDGMREQRRALAAAMVHRIVACRIRCRKVVAARLKPEIFPERRESGAYAP